MKVNISEKALTKLAGNVKRSREGAMKFRPLHVSSFGRGLLLTSEGKVIAEEELHAPFLLKIAALFDLIIPSLGEKLRSAKQLSSSKERDQTLLTYLHNANQSQEEKEKKIAESVNQALCLEELNPKQNIAELSEIKKQISYKQPVAFDELSKLQNQIIKMLYSMQFWDYERFEVILTTALSGAGPLAALDYPSLISKVDSLLKDFDAKKIANLKRSITHFWIKLEALHEWGIRSTNSGLKEGLAPRKASGLISRFLKSRDPPVTDSERRIERAVLAGAQSVNEERIFPFIGSDLDRVFKENRILALPSGWRHHAVGITLHHANDGKYYLYYCNRGKAGIKNPTERKIMDQQDRSYDMVCWEISHPEKLTPSLLRKIAEGPPIRQESFIEGSSGLYKILGLKDPKRIPKSPQKIGNCTWANFKGAMHAAAIAAAYDEEAEGEDRWTHAIEKGTLFLKEMERFGRNESFEPLVHFEAYVNGGLTPRNHLIILSLAAQKLRKKAKEEKNLRKIQQRDSALYKRLLEALKQCPYTVEKVAIESSLDKKLLAKLKDKVEQGEEGAFALVGSICYHKQGEQLTETSLEELSMSVGDLIKRLDLSYPVYLA